MTLEQWEINKWVQSEPTSPEEISQMLDSISYFSSDLTATNITIDTRFVTAYRCALVLVQILVRAHGYRVSHDQHHYRTIEALRFVLPDIDAATREFLQQCRKLRNKTTYLTFGIVSESDLNELVELVSTLKVQVFEKLRVDFPELLKK